MSLGSSTELQMNLKKDADIAYHRIEKLKGPVMYLNTRRNDRAVLIRNDRALLGRKQTSENAVKTKK